MARNSVNIGAYKQQFNGRMGVFFKGVMLKLFTAVIQDTPVDTGRLRANWNFTVQSPSAASDWKARQNPIPTVTAQVNAQVQNGNGTYCLTNNLPYCNRIEYEGWSHTKAPQGMVRRNIVRIVALIRSRAASMGGNNP